MKISQIKITPDTYEPFRLAQGHRVGDLLFISGQTAIGDDGKLLGIGDFDAQAQKAFENLDKVLKAGGSSLKNVVDLLYDEWRKKPVAICTNSAGPFGGTQVITSIQFSLWKIGAWTVPAMFPVPKVQEAFDENGVPADQEGMDKRATVFINELLWCVEARKRMAT